MIGAVLLVGALAIPRLVGWHAQNTCAEYASHPLEATGRSGVPFNELSAETEPACRTAFARDNSALNAFRLGRVLGASGDPQKMTEGFALIRNAYDAGYLLAGFSLAGSLKDGIGTPVDLPAALRTLEAVIAANPPFVEDATILYASYSLLGSDVAAQAEALRILRGAFPKYSYVAFSIGDHYAADVSSLDAQKLAEAWYMKATEVGLDWGYVSLGDLYGNERSPLHDPARSYGAYLDAEKAGLADGIVYAELARRSYFGLGTGKQIGKAFEWAKLGSAAGNGDASYLAGAMLYYEDDVPNDSLGAETYLALAAQQGRDDIAGPILPEVRRRADAIRAIPNGKITTNHCIVSETSTFDANTTYFRNGCGVPVVAFVCSSQMAIDIWNALSGRDADARCEYKKVEHGDMMEMFYGADENSSWIRSAVANSQMTWATCAWPFVPVAGNDNQYSCSEQ